ncbi:MAG: hypothetical protein LBT74_07875 [Acidobacteriota bacterium]|nr:hypothetical protein [Acidobacteriota bacterium]
MVIDGVSFSHLNNRQIIVWKGGQFYRLLEAYDNGWLTLEDLEDITDFYQWVFQAEIQAEIEAIWG